MRASPNPAFHGGGKGLFLPFSSVFSLIKKVGVIRYSESARKVALWNAAFSGFLIFRYTLGYTKKAKFHESG